MSEAVSHDIHEFRLKELEAKALILQGKQTGEYLCKLLETMKHYKRKSAAADKEIATNEKAYLWEREQKQLAQREIATKDAEIARLREAYIDVCEKVLEEYGGCEECGDEALQVAIHMLKNIDGL